ncbi:MAG: hypothetical protein MUF42_16940 [Cytophagaceae bacterium]|jgi:hypothetical protein|nr:hypothetical protein [Cytophagaceae bacterium]
MMTIRLLSCLCALWVLIFSSCSGTKNSEKPDTVRVDSIQGNQPTDSIEIINSPEETDEEGSEGDQEEEENNQLIPQES